MYYVMLMNTTFFYNKLSQVTIINYVGNKIIKIFKRDEIDNLHLEWILKFSLLMN